MRRLLVLPLALTVVLAAAPAHAGLNSNAAVTFHIVGQVTKNQCQYTPPNCIEATTSAPLGAYTVYLLLGAYSDSVGVAGIQFGLDYDGTSMSGVDIDAWGNCADLDFSEPGFPASGTGTTITWDPNNNCQQTSAASLVAWFTVGAYTVDRLAVVPRPVDGKFKVADCSAAEEDLTGLVPSHMGYADFGIGDGYNPCSLIVPVREQTWGSIKYLFGR